MHVYPYINPAVRASEHLVSREDSSDMRSSPATGIRVADTKGGLRVIKLNPDMQIREVNIRAGLNDTS